MKEPHRAGGCTDTGSVARTTIKTSRGYQQAATLKHSDPWNWMDPQPAKGSSASSNHEGGVEISLVFPVVFTLFFVTF